MLQGLPSLVNLVEQTPSGLSIPNSSPSRGQAASWWWPAVGHRARAGAAGKGVRRGAPGARALMAPLVAGREAH